MNVQNTVNCIQNTILVIVNWKGNEKNLLLVKEDYRKLLFEMGASEKNVEDMLHELSTLNNSGEWSEWYVASNKGCYAKSCKDADMAKKFLSGFYNDGEYVFDMSGSSAKCVQAAKEFGFIS